jgi:phosphoglycolate phosphatase
MLRLKAILFDNDATLVDNFGEIRKGIDHIFILHGKTPLTTRQIHATMQRFQAFYLSHGINTPYEQLVEQYFEVAHQGKEFFFPDVPAFIPRLAERGIALGMLSANAHPYTIARYKEAGIDGHFRTLKHDLRCKTTALREFCAEHDYDPQETAYVGDMRIDMLDALAAGVKPIGITRGHDCRDILTEAGAALVIENLNDLLLYL